MKCGIVFPTGIRWCPFTRSGEKPRWFLPHAIAEALRERSAASHEKK